jgi:hypothetical protein
MLSIDLQSDFNYEKVILVNVSFGFIPKISSPETEPRAGA